MDQLQQIRAVVFKEGELWIGQCLEYDIGAQASTIEELLGRLEVAINVEMEMSREINGKPFAGIDKAPAYYEKLWERRTTGLKSLTQPDLDVELALCA